VLGVEALEQTAPPAEQHRDDVELELVEDTGGECELRRPGAVDQHVPAASTVADMASPVLGVGAVAPL
jgi:hypothetical protein